MLLFCIANEHEVIMKSNMDSDSGVSRGGGGVLSTMTDYCARVSLQINPS